MLGINCRRMSLQTGHQGLLCQGLVYKLTLPLQRDWHTEEKSTDNTTALFLESSEGRSIFPFFFPPGNWCEVTSPRGHSIWVNWPQPGHVHACSHHTQQVTDNAELYRKGLQRRTAQLIKIKLFLKLGGALQLINTDVFHLHMRT